MTVDQMRIYRIAQLDFGRAISQTVFRRNNAVITNICRFCNVLPMLVSA